MYDLRAVLPDTLKASDDVSAALSVVEAKPKQLQNWTALAEALSRDDTKLSRRELLDLAITAYPDWTEARLARCTDLVRSRDARLLRGDLDDLIVKGHAKRIDPNHFLALAVFEHDLETIKTHIETRLPDLLSNEDFVPHAVWIDACCCGPDVPNLKRVIEHQAKTASEKRVAHQAVAKLFNAGHRAAAIDVTNWCVTHPMLKTNAAKILNYNTPALRHVGQHLPALITASGWDASDIDEAEICTLNLLGPEAAQQKSPAIGLALEAYAALFEADWDRALSVFKELNTQDIGDQRYKTRTGLLVAMIKLASGLPQPNRPLIRPMVTQESVCFGPKGDTGRTAMFFLPGWGVSGRVFPNILLDSIMGSIGYDCIFMNDPGMLSGAEGLPGLGATAQASVAALRTALDNRGCDRPLMVGVSAGGLGSLHYGVRLHAEQIVVFAGGTVGSSKDMAALGDKRVSFLVNAFDKIDPVDNFVEPVRDLLGATPEPPPIKMIYGEEAIGDRRQANDIASFENVTLLPIAGTRDHGVFWPWLAEHGPGALTKTEV